jgi:response regulator of citrate/malate metabolism
MKILIVEDLPEIRTLTKNYILTIEPKASVDICSSALEAKKMIDNRSYDIVITDMGLSDKYLGGADVAKYAKEVCFSFNVLFSGAFVPSASGDVGFIDYILHKPFKKEELEMMFFIYRKRHCVAA